MATEGRSQTGDEDLELELRSTLATLEELGPAYEHELATTLRERLARFSSLPPRAVATERASGVGWFFLPVAVGGLLIVAMLLSTAMQTYPASSVAGVDREWPYQASADGDAAPLPPAVPAAPSPVPGTN